MKQLNYDMRTLIMQNVRTAEKKPLPDTYTRSQYSMVLSGRLKGDASVRLKLRGRKHPVSITSHYCLCIQHIGRSSRPPMQIKTQVV